VLLHHRNQGIHAVDFVVLIISFKCQDMMYFAIGNTFFLKTILIIAFEVSAAVAMKNSFF
jgi:hypothetical protein